MLASTPDTTSSQLALSLVSDSCTGTGLPKTSSAADKLPSLLQQRCAAPGNYAQELDLPIELIDRILDLCDYSTFLRLAQVNRFFNFYATEVLLNRESSHWRSGGIWVPYRSPHKHEILAALNIRQGDTHVLSRLDYSFDVSERLCHQIAAITRFLRNHVMSIGCLALHFSTLMYWSPNEALNSRSKLVILLEAALAKGCQHFDLSGDIPSFRYYPQQRIHIPCIPHTPNVSRKPNRARFSRWFRSSLSQQTPPSPPGPPLILFPKPHIPAPSSAWESRLSFLADTPSLSKLEMESSLMLNHFLSSHTFNLLRNQSGVLRKLKIHQSVTICEEFFSMVSLPVLEIFAYTADYVQPRLFNLLFVFLIRHPSIQKIKLKFSPIRFNEADYPSFDTNTFLPNLKTLYAHAKTISWFLRDPNAFLNLERVSVEARNRYLVKLDDVDAALIALGSRMSDSASCCKSPIHLQLKVSVDTDFCSWLSSHVTNPYASPIQHLKEVGTLTLSARDTYAELKARHLDNLIAWSSLFPNLRWLRLRGYFDDELHAAVRSERFITTLKDMCPLLERCSANYWDWVKG